MAPPAALALLVAAAMAASSVDARSPRGRQPPPSPEAEAAAMRVAQATTVRNDDTAVKLYNTGVDDHHVALFGPGDVDPHWLLVSRPDAAPGTRPNAVTLQRRNAHWGVEEATSTAAAGAAADNSAHLQWRYVGPSADAGSAPMPVGDYVYATTLTVEPWAYSPHLGVALSVAAANVATVLVNGVLVTTTAPTDLFTPDGAGVFLTAEHLRAGDNTLQVVVNNNDGSLDMPPAPTGLCVRVDAIVVDADAAAIDARNDAQVRDAVRSATEAALPARNALNEATWRAALLSQIDQRRRRR